MLLNNLWLVFIKALILQHFDPKYYILIKTNVLSYANSDMLSCLVFKTNLDRVISKINLD